MPRKTSKIEKPPLLFLERTLCGARLQHVPEVRAAINPREFFTDTQDSGSTSHSWVSPQFDGSLAAAPPVRRGRRKCLSTTSILSSYTQPSRKNSVCKFPSLAFQARSRAQSHQPKTTSTKNSAIVSDVGNHLPRGSGRGKRTTSTAQHSDAPHSHTTASITNRNVERFSDGAASSSRHLVQTETVQNHRIQAGDAPSSASNDLSDVGPPPPDVDTPPRPSTSTHLLSPQSSAPVCNEPSDILVADTPERDYGLKVTWRRRRGLMMMLKERGLLSDSDVLIHS